MTQSRLDISTTSIVKFFGLALLILFLWQIIDILALLFVVLIIVAALGPAVQWMTGHSIPRPAAVSLIYAGILLIFGLLISLIVPPLIDQIHALTVAFPVIVQQVTPIYEILRDSNLQEILQSLSTELSAFTQGVFSATAQVFGGAAATLTVFVLSFYMLVDVKQARDSLVQLIPAAKLNPILTLLTKVEEKLGSWLRGQFTLSLIIGIVTFLGLSILNVPYALTIAVLAGLLEIVPYIGPIVVAIITAIVAYSAGSWQLALASLAFFTIVQQVESNFLVPKVMQSAVGLSPVIVILALAIGAKLGGIPGAILAIPLTAVLSVVIQEWPRIHRA